MAKSKIKKLLKIRTGTKKKPKGLLHAVKSHNDQLEEAYKASAPVQVKRKK